MQNSATNNNQPGVEFLVDAHVHIHPCFEADRLLDAAATNFTEYSAVQSPDVTSIRVLCLTECAGVHCFHELAKKANAADPEAGSGASRWSLRTGDDNKTLVAEHEKRGKILLIAGRQIVTAERLEVLALGTDKSWEDGADIRSTIGRVIDEGAIPVVPWGFGKWIGRRGKIVRELIREYRNSMLYLGDNSGRLGIMPEPNEFRIAREAGIRVLPGSDPLPFPSQYVKAGSYGFVTERMNVRNGNWTSLSSALQSGEIRFRNFGSLESPIPFCCNQIAMQIKTRAANRGVSR